MQQLKGEFSRRRSTLSKSVLLAGIVVAASVRVAVADGAADLAQKLSNPVSDLISVPLQLNYDEGIGLGGNGSRWTLNVQPVVPISLNADWNIISRTIVPLVSTDGIPAGAGSDTGIGDTVQSFFFSPKAPTAGGWIWGAGPVFLLPTSSDRKFGPGEWGVGLTGVALKQDGPWTYGALANHIVDVDGSIDINSTFLQPFVSYTTPDAWTFSLNTESTYNWAAKDWSVPVNAAVSKLVTFGDQPVSLGAGVRYWADSATGGPDGWGARFTMTFLFPK
jgi:hypothetical protein